MNFDIAKIEAAITPRTKAILAVHLHGLPVQLGPVMALAKRYNLRVIEDCCQAHGARWDGRKVGTIGDCAAFSFNQNKMLCSGEGGMFVSDDEALFEKAKQLWSFGETRTPAESRDYHAYALGWMYRNNDLTAAFGRAQLAKLDSYLALTAENAAALTAGLRDVPGLILPTEPAGCQHNWYNYTIRFTPEVLGDRAQWSERRYRIVQAFGAEGVPTGVWQQFILPAMTVFQAKNAYGKGCPWDCPHSGPVDYNPALFPEAQRHCDSHTGMTVPLRAPNGPDIVGHVAKAIAKVMGHLDQLED